MLLPRRTSRALVVVLALGAALLAPVSPAQALTRPDTLYDARPVGAGPVEPGFPLDYLGVSFEVPPGWDAHEQLEDRPPGEALAVRFRADGRWGGWQAVEEDGAQAEGRWSAALLSAGDADAYQVRGVPATARNAVAAAINTTDGPPVVTGYRRAGTATAVAACKSRAEWRADETLRTSTRDHAPVQAMTVHHTATANDDADPDARVRAIYTYHVQTNGWADIGYNALVSEDGTVYEGRWSGSDSKSCAAGGTGWDFGHRAAADGSTPAGAMIVTGAHTGGYNTGNYGVALLGTFTGAAPKPAARNALVAYLAELAQRHGLDPQGQVLYENATNSRTVGVISGHRDFTATECPGGVLYADLPSVRADVKALLPAANAAPVVTITSPTTADAVTVTETSAGAGVGVSVTAGATDDVTAPADLRWAWTDGTGATLATVPSFATTLAVGTHTLTASATDGGAAVGRDTVTVTVTPAGVASGERTVAGTVSGTYLDTHTDGGRAEALTEVESGGKRSDRVSLLEHVWTVPVGGGTTLVVDATATPSTDGDGFAVSYSTDGGASYSAPVVTFPSGTGGIRSAPLPAGFTGVLHVRVVDTDRSRGGRALDTLTVDHLAVR